MSVIFVAWITDEGFRGLTGTVTIYLGLSDAQEKGPLGTFVRRSRKTLDVMAPTGGNLYRQRAALARLVARRDAVVRVLLVDPGLPNYDRLIRFIGVEAATMRDELSRAVRGLRNLKIEPRFLGADQFPHGLLMRDRASAFGQTQIDTPTTGGRDTWPSIRFRHWHNRELRQRMADEFDALWEEAGRNEVSRG